MIPPKEKDWKQRKLENPANFRRAKEILEGAKRAEDRLKREIHRLCDWDNNQDKSFYQNVKRQIRRNRQIERRAAGLICPACHEKQKSKRSFVITADRRVICRRCFHNPQEQRDVKTIETKIFSKCGRVDLDPAALVEAREAAAITKPLFATRCNWSRAYQQKLETGQVKSVTIEQAKVMLRALALSKLVTKDDLYEA